MKSKKAVKYLIIFLVILLLIILGVYYFQKVSNEKMVANLFNDTDSNYLITDLVNNQKTTNAELTGYLNDAKYTIDNPKIIQDPYQISPLTALIIFQTSKEEEITVKINDNDVTIINATTNHSIPVYGLLNNYNNVITLTDNDQSYTYYIQTNATAPLYPLNIEYKDSTLNNDLYFLSGPVLTGLSAYDSDGNLRWFLSVKFTMDMEWLPNGHFLVGLSEGSLKDRKIGFAEMDYLGKIYNYYVSQNGYDFEFQTLSNGNYMLAGGNVPLNYDNIYIYEINPLDGKTVSYLDLTSLILSIDPDFDKSLLTADAIRNGFYYNEDTDELIISVRQINALISVQYKTNKLNWIYAYPGVFGDKFKDYLVTSSDNLYPLGQHSPFITKEGYLAFYNNGYNRFKIDANPSSYLGKSSKAEIVKIGNDLKATKIWTSDDYVTGYFNQKYGYFRILATGNKLIDYGWCLHNEFMNNANNKMSAAEGSIDDSYAEIVELNQDNKIVFKAHIEEGQYRAFKHSLYDDMTDNTEVGTFNYFNTFNDTDYQIINTKDIINDLNNALGINTNALLTKNTLDFNYTLNTTDSVDIYLVGKKGKTYLYHYKEANQKFDSTLNINLAKGDYALYLKINDTFYRTNKVIKN
jgi:hypothetical protein